MDFDIRAGKRVLYKQGNSNWMVGTVQPTNIAEVNEKGIWIPIIPKDNNEELHWAEIHNIFTDGIKLDEWMKDYLISKEDYIEIIKSEDFEKNLENAWVSDGEYYYYPITKFSENWILKQPFEYIIRTN